MNRIISFFLVLIAVVSGWFNCYKPPEEAKFSADYTAGERNMEKYCGIHSYVGDCGGVGK